MFWPKRSSLGRLSRTQDPTKGQFNFFTTLFALRQVIGRQQAYENPCQCVYCVLRWVCVCGVLGHLAPVHRCARLVCCVACVVSLATWLLFTGVSARCVVLRVRCPGPLGSCSPVRSLGVLLGERGVPGLLALVHQ